MRTKTTNENLVNNSNQPQTENEFSQLIGETFKRIYEFKNGSEEFKKYGKDGSLLTVTINNNVTPIERFYNNQIIGLREVENWLNMKNFVSDDERISNIIEEELDEVWETEKLYWFDETYYDEIEERKDEFIENHSEYYFDPHSVISTIIEEINQNHTQ